MNVTAGPQLPAAASLAASNAWLDLLLFFAGLGVAWWQGWQTGDLIWSLWLSSLTVGYAMILVGAFAPCLMFLRDGKPRRALQSVIGALVTLAFFTVHFGLFHAAHASILNTFFPLGIKFDIPGPDMLLLVMSRYGWFLPLVLLSKRKAFQLPSMPPEPPPMSVKAADIDARKARQGHGQLLLWLPYLNVIRMHLLIFALAALAHWQLDGFASYVLVYAAFFLPWGALRKFRYHAE